MAVSEVSTNGVSAADAEGLRRRPTPNPELAIPRMSAGRMEENAAEPIEKTHGNWEVDAEAPTSDTILYLAYGSNLASKTFRGVRGVRPLSQINVSVPTLRLMFNLPGLPYKEPCFANVAFRKLPEKPPHIPGPPSGSPDWDGGLMGVVYEVTREDYRQIMRTEGGGSGYQEIFVPCIPLAPRFEIPEGPSFPRLPRPFIARTLCSSPVPDETPGDRPWWAPLLTRPHRPDPEYAQASERYLNLLRDGAREHDLPEEYQKYLNDLKPYTVTHWRQTLGQILFFATGGITFFAFVTIAKYFADENGKYPKVLSITMTLLFNIIWMFYDCIFKPLFGDGERTEGDDKAGAALKSHKSSGDSMIKERVPLLSDS